MVPLLLVAWMFLPRQIGEVRVVEARTVPVDTQKFGKSILIVFSSTDEIARVRERLGLGYISARLSDCANEDWSAFEVVDQRAEYMTDRGRVQGLDSGSDGPWSYRVVFDDNLSRTQDHEAQFVPALSAPGGLCFSLYGASMWFGWGWSNSVRIEL
ncbi:MAG: hypothetical protein EOP94_01765 [Zymomonas sp.]|nr:MAG: hypothetical protein EOP94_01765 [Zymomonas sp.]